MGGYDHILSKYGRFLTFPVGEIWKIGLCKTVTLRKNLQNAEFTYIKHGKPTLHSLIANHVLEMFVKLGFNCIRLKRNTVLLWWFWTCFPFVFIKACSHDATCILGFFCTVMSKPKKWFTSQWIWKELCTSVYHHTYRFYKCWHDLL